MPRKSQYPFLPGSCGLYSVLLRSAGPHYSIAGGRSQEPQSSCLRLLDKDSRLMTDQQRPLRQFHPGHPCRQSLLYHPQSLYRPLLRLHPCLPARQYLQYRLSLLVDLYRLCLLVDLCLLCLQSLLAHQYRLCLLCLQSLLAHQYRLCRLCLQSLLAGRYHPLLRLYPCLPAHQYLQYRLSLLVDLYRLSLLVDLYRQCRQSLLARQYLQYRLLRPVDQCHPCRP